MPISYYEANEKFTPGISKDEVIDLFGQPEDIDKFDDIETWYYYLPETMVRKMDPGDQWESFMIDFKNSEAIRIRRIVTVVN